MSTRHLHLFIVALAASRGIVRKVLRRRQRGSAESGLQLNAYTPNCRRLVHSSYSKHVFFLDYPLTDRANFMNRTILVLRSSKLWTFHLINLGTHLVKLRCYITELASNVWAASVNTIIFIVMVFLSIFER